jgi:hypothetical protein
MGPGPVLSGTITGSGSVTFYGYSNMAVAFLDAFDATFTGTADVTSPSTRAGPIDPAGNWLARRSDPRVDEKEARACISQGLIGRVFSLPGGGRRGQKLDSVSRSGQTTY